MNKPVQVDIDAILEERGKRYGGFSSHAYITQRLKFMTHEHAEAYDVHLTASAKEALDMIFHKIGRIVNGDPTYVDSWDDIAGYAKLQADIIRNTPSKKY